MTHWYHRGSKEGQHKRSAMNPPLPLSFYFLSVEPSSLSSFFSSSLLLSFSPLIAHPPPPPSSLYLPHLHPPSSVPCTTMSTPTAPGSKIPVEYASEKLEFDSENSYTGSTELDPVAVGKLRRKIDWHLIPLIAVLYLCSFLDRVNIGKGHTPVTICIPNATESSMGCQVIITIRLTITLFLLIVM